MSLDFYLRRAASVEECLCCECGHRHQREVRGQLYWRNITHNLNKMFSEAGVYEILWRGDGLIARNVLPRLEGALATMRAEPVRFKKFDAANGWGTYEHALEFLADVITACREHPDGILECSC